MEKNFKINNTVIIFYFFFLIVFLLLTNEINFQYKYNNAAASSFYYLEIAKNFPLVANFDNNIQSYVHSERFLISYIMGFFSYMFHIEIYSIFFFLTFVSIVLIIFIYLKILDAFLISLINKITLLNLLMLNPYFFRYFIQNPMMLNDLIFILGISLIILSLLNKNLIFFYISITLLVISRQTFLIIFLSLFFVFLAKKENFLDLKKIIFIIIIFLINFGLSKLYINNANLSEFYNVSFLGIFYYIYNNFDLKDFLIFILLPLISLGPILIVYFIEILKLNLKIKIFNENILFILITLGFILQPLLAGPEISGRNIIRLSFFCYLPLIFLFIKNHKNLMIKNLSLFFLNFLFFLWSFHPNFSSIKIFDFLRFSKDFIIF